MQTLLQDRYAGFNDTHATEKLREVHGVAISRASVRRLRQALGWAAVLAAAAQHRARRPREAAAGQLVQLDGNPYDWLQGRGPAMTLLGAIDDATSEVVALHFRPTEDLHGYATLLQQMVVAYGLPVARYGDGVSILVRTDRHWSLAEQLAGTQAPTHIGQVLQDLGIGYVRAHSPQAKGRIERLWETLKIGWSANCGSPMSTLGRARTRCLPGFRVDFNRRFTRPAAAPPVWRRPPAVLALLLGCRYWRVVARDNTIRLGHRLIAVPPGAHHRSFARCRVEVRELLDGHYGRVLRRPAHRAAAGAGGLHLGPSPYLARRAPAGPAPQSAAPAGRARGVGGRNTASSRPPPVACLLLAPCSDQEPRPFSPGTTSPRCSTHDIFIDQRQGLSFKCDGDGGPLALDFGRRMLEPARGTEWTLVPVRVQWRPPCF